MMKKILAMLACALVLVACGSKDNPETPGGGGSGSDSGSTISLPITGVWELNSVTTKTSVGGVNVSVYIDFGTDGKFTLYQKIGEGRYTKFTGSYTLTSNNKLSGKYDGGNDWGPYTAEIEQKTLKLTTPGGKEVDTYKKVSSVPASVTDNLY